MHSSMFAGRAAAAERGHGAGHQEAQGAEDGGHLAGERAPGVALVTHTLICLAESDNNTC